MNAESKSTRRNLRGPQPVLFTLPPAQTRRLRTWLLEEGISYRETRERLKKHFGLKTSITALSNFYAKQHLRRPSEPNLYTVEFTVRIKKRGKVVGTSNFSLPFCGKPERRDAAPLRRLLRSMI